jgi:hypothetical protein
MYAIMYKDRSGAEKLLDYRFKYRLDADAKIKRLADVWEDRQIGVYHRVANSYAYARRNPAELIMEAWRVFIPEGEEK